MSALLWKTQCVFWPIQIFSVKRWTLYWEDWGFDEKATEKEETITIIHNGDHCCRHQSKLLLPFIGSWPNHAIYLGNMRFDFSYSGNKIKKIQIEHRIIGAKTNPNCWKCLGVLLTETVCCSRLYDTYLQLNSYFKNVNNLETLLF